MRGCSFPGDLDFPAVFAAIPYFLLDISLRPQRALRASSTRPLCLCPACYSNACDLHSCRTQWTLVYDTIYAHQDKIDDERVGVRSTPVEEHPRRGLTFLLSGLDDEEQIHVRALVLRALCHVQDVETTQLAALIRARKRAGQRRPPSESNLAGLVQKRRRQED